jgi:hypothetical protein
VDRCRAVLSGEGRTEGIEVSAIVTRLWLSKPDLYKIVFSQPGQIDFDNPAIAKRFWFPIGIASMEYRTDPDTWQCFVFENHAWEIDTCSKTGDAILGTCLGAVAVVPKYITFFHQTSEQLDEYSRAKGLSEESRLS